MASSRTFRIVNGPTKEEILAAWKHSQRGVRPTVIFLLILLKEDGTEEKVQREVLIVNVTPQAGGLGVQLRIDAKTGEAKAFRRIVADYHSTARTGRWQEEIPA